MRVYHDQGEVFKLIYIPLCSTGLISSDSLKISRLLNISSCIRFNPAGRISADALLTTWPPVRRRGVAVAFGPGTNWNISGTKNSLISPLFKEWSRGLLQGGAFLSLSTLNKWWSVQNAGFAQLELEGSWNSSSQNENIRIYSHCIEPNVITFHFFYSGLCNSIVD